MCVVYILRSLKSERYYVGSTSDMEKRLIEHNRGKNISTRGRGPFVVVYTEEYHTKAEAIRRELEIKSYKGGNGFKNLLDRALR